MSTSQEGRVSDSVTLVNHNESTTDSVANGFKLHLLEKLTEADRQYKQGLYEYKESIQSYNLEIEKLKNKIDNQSELCDKEEKNLLMIEHELLFENKAYDKLQVQCLGFLNSIEELQMDYKDILDEEKYATTFKRKERELLDALDEIEIAELSLLKRELERLNFLESFEPKQRELKSLKVALKELELEKRYFESMGLQKVSSVQLENKSSSMEKLTEVVDTVEIKE